VRGALERSTGGRRDKAGASTSRSSAIDADDAVMPDSRLIACPKCKEELCTHCRSRAHEGLTCLAYQYQVKELSDPVLKYCAKMGWMRCFECGHMIEKSAACNHMRCVCGVEFCYKCGGAWGTCKCEVFSADAVLRHQRVGVTRLRCPLCIQSSDTVDELEVHIRAHHPFACRTCRTDHASAAQQRTHFVRVHHTCPVRVSSARGGADVCRCRLDSAAALREHAWEQHLVLLCTGCGRAFDDVTTCNEGMEKGWKQAVWHYREHCGPRLRRCEGAEAGLEFLRQIGARVKEGRTALHGPPPERLLGAGRWMTARGAGLKDDASGLRRVFVAANGAVYEAHG